jgi:hypothetical protein
MDKDLMMQTHLTIDKDIINKEAKEFWQIPQQIFKIRNDYKIYLRHYTKSIYKTIMFFYTKVKNYFN